MNCARRFDKHLVFKTVRDPFLSQLGPIFFFVLKGALNLKENIDLEMHGSTLQDITVN